MRAAQPLPTNSSNSAGIYRRESIECICLRERKRKSYHELRAGPAGGSIGGVVRSVERPSINAESAEKQRDAERTRWLVPLHRSPALRAVVDRVRGGKHKRV